MTDPQLNAVTLAISGSGYGDYGDGCGSGYGYVKWYRWAGLV